MRNPGSAEHAVSGCVAFTNGKRFSPHNLLFCNSKHPAHNKPQRRELTKIREKYIVCPIGQNASMVQVRSRTFTCTWSDEVGENLQDHTTMNTRTGGPGETVYLTQWIRMGKKPQLRPELMKRVELLPVTKTAENRFKSLAAV